MWPKHVTLKHVAPFLFSVLALLLDSILLGFLLLLLGFGLCLLLKLLRRLLEVPNIQV
jgi:hypothetical protein